MPMHRLQRFDASPLSVTFTYYSRTLRSVFRQAVGYALASALGASGCYAASADRVPSQASVAGSAGAGQGAPIEQTSRSAPVSPVCPSGIAQLFAGLTAQPFDAAEFRIQPAATSGPQILFAQGVLCGTATDPAACQSKIAVAADKANLPLADSLPMYGMVTRYVLTTRVDEVHKYQSRQELLQFLGPIDSPEDTLLLLYYDKYPVLCESALQSGFSGIDPTSFRELGDGYQVLLLAQGPDCSGSQSEHVTLHVARDGTVTETARVSTSQTTVCAGRRPEGLRSRHVATTASALGEHFARMAHLEQASIAAFEVLAAELAQHGAPFELVAGARSAAADEVRHTATTHELARRFGVSPTAAEVAPRPLRSLQAIAIDNAREGCVRECFGAALGCYQAQSAADPVIAAAMAQIAEDETQHAALAFAIDTWVQSRLDDLGRARVTAARAHAVGALRGELGCVPDEVTRAALGLPDAVAALRLYSALEQSLWAA